MRAGDVRPEYAGTVSSDGDEPPLAVAVLKFGRRFRGPIGLRRGDVGVENVGEFSRDESSMGGWGSTGTTSGRGQRAACWKC